MRRQVPAAISRLETALGFVNLVLALHAQSWRCKAIAGALPLPIGRGGRGLEMMGVSAG